MNYDRIPKEMKLLPHWVLWGVPGKPLKCPFNPTTMTEAKAGQPDTWGSFEQALQRVSNGDALGLGFEFHTSDPFVGVDLDTVRDPENGVVADYALEIVQRLNSYTEVSQSGYGLHVICKGEISIMDHKRKLPENNIERPDTDPKTGNQKIIQATGEPVFKVPEIEIYNEGRYFALTGILFEGAGDF